MRLRSSPPAIRTLPPNPISRDNWHSDELKDDLKLDFLAFAEKVAQKLVAVGPDLATVLCTTFDHTVSRDPLRCLLELLGGRRPPQGGGRRNDSLARFGG